MRARPGRIYSHQGRWRRFFKALGIVLLLLVVLFFYLYFQWKKYIVYTGDSLFLDLPFLREEVVTRESFDVPVSEEGVITSFTPVETEEPAGEEPGEPASGEEGTAEPGEETGEPGEDAPTEAPSEEPTEAATEAGGVKNGFGE